MLLMTGTTAPAGFRSTTRSPAGKIRPEDTHRIPGNLTAVWIDSADARLDLGILAAGHPLFTRAMSRINENLQIIEPGTTPQDRTGSNGQIHGRLSEERFQIHPHLPAVIVAGHPIVMKSNDVIFTDPGIHHGTRHSGRHRALKTDFRGCTAAEIDALKANRPDQAQLQTQLLAMNLRSAET